MDLVHYANSKNHTNVSDFVKRNDFAAIAKKYQPIVITVYSSTALFAIVANTVTLLVLYNGKKTAPDLKKYLMSLAMADLLMAILIAPFTYTQFMYSRWLFDPFFCPVVQSIQVLCVFSSFYTLIVVGIDRYYAIVHPMNSEHWLKNFPRITILVVWMSGFALSLVTYFNTDVIEFQIDNETYLDCRETFEPAGAKMYTVSLFMILYAIPVFILCLIYSRMKYAIDHRQFQNNLPQRLQRQKLHVNNWLMLNSDQAHLV